ncbi:MAG: penicillin-binding protein 2 [Planctomycetes bacterium]|nr:penicillin-binding protein 2 [Planctomycetota bacterium]
MALIRLRVLVWIIAALFAVVEGRLVLLQFVTRDFWESEARSSRTGGRAVPFQRGSLLDRYGRPLAEGETVHQLTFVFQEFRRETPVGQLLGAGRILLDAAGQAERPMTVSALASRPDEWVSFVLATSEEQIERLPSYVREDLEFYLRRLLDLEAKDFRAARKEQADKAAPAHALVEDSLARVEEAARRQLGAIADLAQAIETSPAEFIDLIDEEIAEIAAAVQRALAGSPDPESVKQQRAVQKDYESRQRVLERSVTYRAVYLVSLVPERYRGFEIRDVQRRSYPEEFENVSPTLLGWVGFPTDEVLKVAEDDWLLFQELRSRPPEEIDVETAEHIDWLKLQIRHVDYTADEEQGVTGLEGLLEPVLRGRRGWQIVEQDSAKRDTRLLEMTPPIHGLDVRLTLDVELQLACQRVLEQGRQEGAIVLLDPRDGAIRALATWPSPTRQEIKKEYSRLIADASHPLSHRAFRPPGNPPPPGSVFKVVAAAAALESGRVNAGTAFTCDKYLAVGRTQLKCMGSHGTVTITTALEKSCNIFFYRLAGVVGLEPIAVMARRFGCGEASGFGDPARLGLPAGAVSIGEMACPLQAGSGVTFAMRTAIGHAAIDDVTPLQVAALMAPLANGGLRVRPWLIDTIGGERAPREAPASIGLSANTLSLIRQGMIAVAETGTAHPRDGTDLRPYRVAAKTGTPQAEGEKDHAWIAGYFPHDDPRLAFAIFLENVGVGGGAACTPVLGALLAQPEFEEEFAP